MKLRWFTLLFLAVAVNSLHAQEGGPVKWMTFEEAVAKAKVEKRKLFIDVYTDWCGWCKVMDKNTFSDPIIAKLLNENFYPVKLDAEQTADIVFNGTTFKFVPYGNKGTHQLAATLLKNQLSYPTVTVVGSDFSFVQPYPGYKKPEELHALLSFYIGDYQDKGIDEFNKTYKSPYVAAPATSGPGK